MELLTRDKMYPYQVNALLHSLYNDDAMLWLQMGLGKTAITLTAITDRQRAGQVKKVLIFGPLRVIQSVWHREARKWEHLKHLRFSIIHGDKAKRRRALFADADIYLCNYESMNWLAEELITQFEARGLPFPFQMVVYDEVTRVKSSTSVRIAGGKRDVRDRRTGKTTSVKREGWRQHIDKFGYRMGLTGSPAPNGYLDLHGQFLAVDGGHVWGLTSPTTEIATSLKATMGGATQSPTSGGTSSKLRSRTSPLRWMQRSTFPTYRSSRQRICMWIFRRRLTSNTSRWKTRCLQLSKGARVQSRCSQKLVRVSSVCR